MSDVDGHPVPHEGRTQTGRAVILVIVAVVVAALVLRHTGTSSAGHTSTAASTTTSTTVRTPPRSTTTTLPLVAPADIKVQVLNGLQTGNLAGNLSTKLHADGYQTLPPNNTTTPTQISVVYLARRGYYREAVKLAARLGLPTSDIQRSIPPTAPIPTGVVAASELIVVIGASLQSVASSA